MVVARELTKMHEEFLRGTASEIRATLAARASVKGEITLLIGKAYRRWRRTKRRSPMRSIRASARA